MEKVCTCFYLKRLRANSRSCRQGTDRIRTPRKAVTLDDKLVPHPREKQLLEEPSQKD